MKLYRGMSLAQWESCTGLTRKGAETVDQLYAGDCHASAGDMLITVGGPSEGNALAMHSLDSVFYKGAFLSFTESFDVAAYYALKDRWQIEELGIVVEISSEQLAARSIRAIPNRDRYPWEHEVSIVMGTHEALPIDTISMVHYVDPPQLRRGASALSAKWPDVTFPNLLREVGY